VCGEKLNRGGRRARGDFSSPIPDKSVRTPARHEATNITKHTKAAVASRREAAVCCGWIPKSQVTNQEQWHL